jgi:hypothetical protein
MAAKKQLYTEIELEWAEAQLLTWRQYVDDNPLNELKDRMSYKTTANGGSVPMTVASIEQQGKFIQDTMKNYLSLVKEVDAMRAVEEAKKEARGSASVPHRMQ